MHTVGIIGGGFSGLMAAVHLTTSSQVPLQLYIVNAGNAFPRGVAYSTQAPWLLLNVRAQGMSAYPDKPLHFVEWLKRQPEYAGLPEEELRLAFIPRKTYGNYLDDIWKELNLRLLQQHRHRVSVINDTITGAEVIGNKVILQSLVSGTITVDRVLLATGHSAPSTLPFQGSELSRSPMYFGNPWSRWEDNFTDKGGDAFILGSGLTMVDVVQSLLRNNFKGTIYFNSRNGLLPLSHGDYLQTQFYSASDIKSPRLDDLVKLYQEEAAKYRELGLPAFLAIDKFRPLTQQLWHGLTLSEKNYFLKHYKGYWNVRRHRIAKEINAVIQQALASGKLKFVEGRVSGVTTHADSLSVHFQQGDFSSLLTNITYFFNCTGPQESYRNSTNPLLNSLLQAGEVQPDCIDWGLDVAPSYACKKADGTESKLFFATGCLIKGTYWETFAVPDLRLQVKQVCDTVLSNLPAESA